MDGESTVVVPKTGSNGDPDVLLTNEAIGKMIESMRAELGAQLGVIQTDQVEAGKTLEAMARSHRRMRRRVMKFLNSMAVVYQRQQSIEERLTEIDAWQKLHDKDHRDSKPPPTVPEGKAKSRSSRPPKARG